LLDYRNVEVRCQSDLSVMSVSGRADRELPYCPGGHMCRYFHSAVVNFFSKVPASVQLLNI